MSTSTTSQRRPDGRVEGSIRAWITANVGAMPRVTRRDVCRITRNVNKALGLGMTGGLARQAIRHFVARVLAQA